MKNIKLILSLTFVFCSLFSSVYANTEIDITENIESQMEEIEERVIVVPVTKDYVATYANLVNSATYPGQISIHANITSDPISNTVTINGNWRGQIDKKTEWMIRFPND